jgi:negative regulator of sigma E activity
MVKDTVSVPFAAKRTLGEEKWQLTPAGSDAQPSPMVSVKPLIEVRFTLTVALCVVATVTLGGVTVRLNPEPGLLIVVEADVDGECSASPL